MTGWDCRGSLGGCHPHHGAGFGPGNPVTHIGHIIGTGPIHLKDGAEVGAAVLLVLGVTILWHRITDGEWG